MHLPFWRKVVSRLEHALGASDASQLELGSSSGVQEHSNFIDSAVSQ